MALDNAQGMMGAGQVPPWMLAMFPFLQRGNGDGNGFDLQGAIAAQQQGQADLMDKAGLWSSAMPQRDMAGNYMVPGEQKRGLERNAQLNPQAFDPETGAYLGYGGNKGMDLAPNPTIMNGNATDIARRTREYVAQQKDAQSQSPAGNPTSVGVQGPQLPSQNEVFGNAPGVAAPDIEGPINPFDYPLTADAMEVYNKMIARPQTWVNQQLKQRGIEPTPPGGWGVNAPEQMPTVPTAPAVSEAPIQQTAPQPAAESQTNPLLSAFHNPTPTTPPEWLNAFSPPVQTVVQPADWVGAVDSVAPANPLLRSFNPLAPSSDYGKGSIPGPQAPPNPAPYQAVDGGPPVNLGPQPQQPSIEALERANFVDSFAGLYVPTNGISGGPSSTNPFLGFGDYDWMQTTPNGEKIPPIKMKMVGPDPAIAARAAQLYRR